MWPLNLKFVSCKHCFIALPRRFIQEKLANHYNIKEKSSEILVFKIEYLENKNETITYVSWNGAVSSSVDCIEIDEAFGSANGMKNNQLIILKSVDSFSGQISTDCSHCSVITPSSDDYEVLISNIAQVEILLLHNIRVVTNNLTVPLWLFNGNLKILIKIFEVHPRNCDYVYLSNRTEINVEGSESGARIRPTEEHERESVPEYRSNGDSSGSQSMISSVLSMVKSYLHEAPVNKSDSQKSIKGVIISENMVSNEVLTPTIRTKDIDISEKPFKVVPVEDHSLDRRYTCSILISPQDVDLDSNEQPILANIVKILSSFEISQIDPKEKQPKSIPVQEDRQDQDIQIMESYFRSSLVLIELNESCQPGTCQVPYNIRRKMGLTISSKIKINGVRSTNLDAATMVTITPLEGVNLLNQNKEEIKLKLLSCLNGEFEDKFLIINKYTLVNLEGADYLMDGNPPYASSVTYMHEDSLKNIENLVLNKPLITRITTSYGLRLPLKTITDLDTSIGFKSKDELKPIDHANFVSNDSISSRMQSFLENQISLRCKHRTRFHYGSILLHGPKKCGKTYYIKRMSDFFRSSKDLIFTSTVSCKQLRGKRIETFKKLLFRSLAEVYYRQPSILFIDDIDSVVGTDIRQAEEKGAETVYRKRIIASFISLLAQLDDNNDFFGNKIAIVATCTSLNNLDNQIINMDGRHYFSELIEINSPDQATRINILKNLIHDHNNIESTLAEDDFNNFSQRCDSFLPIDLKTVLERALMKAAVRSTLSFETHNRIKLSVDDLNEALKDYIPISLRGISLQQKSGRKFADIGGMIHAKETLTSLVLLPIRYPILFSKCPIRSQASVLLYGPPGCGKTLIAEALANEESINLICVRGPELLSKYIGASEAAVRELFQKAEAAQPCIVFFDEFESIAPRRGHDSTGVTDRVVNQLLTMMDGVEELSKGVFIVAATSRPDLIDPALLRPGRFDKHIYCGLPNEEDRLEILGIMSSKIQLDSDIDLTNLSRETKYYSGADLQSLLYTAQLKSVHERIDGSDLQASGFQIKVAVRHLDAALKELDNFILKSNLNYSVQYPEKFSKRPQTTSSRATLA